MRLVDLATMSMYEQHLIDFVPSTTRVALRRKLAAHRKHAANLHHLYDGHLSSDSDPLE